ncbi:MAG: class II aldolase/adducin family protein [Syntrophobacterales bacterium]|jgi:L-fuculose-phosphate aldolase|nr:class II aldolase/adducin family protein [Syntrophobacterales bacterium]
MEISSDFQNGKEEIVRVARRAVDMGLQSGMGGNISLRWGSHFLMKVSGRSLYGLTDADIVVVDANGKVQSGVGIPTKEVRLHLGIYRTRGDANGIVHYHAPFATAFAVKGIPITALTIHARKNFPAMPVVPELEDGSEELAAQAVGAFSDQEINLVLLAAHGLVAIGKTLDDAEALAELAEEAAKIALFARLLGLP